MRAKKEIRRDLYKCSLIGDTVNIEMLYEIDTIPDKERLIRFGCGDYTKCGAGIPISAWETKLDWEKCPHPLSPKPLDNPFSPVGSIFNAVDGKLV